MKTQSHYENKISKIINSILNELITSINSHLAKHTDNFIYIDPELLPLLVAGINSEHLSKISNEDIFDHSGRIYGRIYAHNNLEKQPAKVFDDKHYGLINLESYARYLNNNHGAKSYGEFLKIAFTAYKLTLGRDLYEYFYLIEDENYKGIDNAELEAIGSYPKSNLLKKIGLLVMSNEKPTQEEQILKLSNRYSADELFFSQKIHSPESLCKTLGIEKINVIKTREYSYDLYFKTSNGFYYIVLNGDESSAIEHQSLYRAHKSVKYKSNIYHSGKNETPISALDIELSDDGFTLAEMIYLDDITTIFTQEKRTPTEKIKNFTSNIKNIPTSKPALQFFGFLFLLPLLFMSIYQLTHL